MRSLSRFLNKREINRIYISHTLRSVALSFIGIYIPAYLLTNGYSLSQVIIFYIIFHLSGLLITLFGITRWINKFGLIKILRLYYPLEIAFFVLVYAMPKYSIPLELVAVIGGLATFVYWVPLNILLIKHIKSHKAGSDLATFFALPKIFGVIGPLISAVLVVTIGFWSIFIVTFLGLLLSFLPLIKIKTGKVKINIQMGNILHKLKSQKKLFILEMFDNIIEESQWFWGVYVFLMIGGLAVPGIVGSLVSIGGIIFLFLVGKKANKKPFSMVVVAGFLLAIISVLRIFVTLPVNVYILTVIGSFIMTLFLVPYVSIIYRKAKGKKEAEFIVLREIPTVVGRLVVFIVALMVINNPQYFFVLPAIVSLGIGVIFYLRKNHQ